MLRIWRFLAWIIDFILLNLKYMNKLWSCLLFLILLIFRPKPDEGRIDKKYEVNFWWLVPILAEKGRYSRINLNSDQNSFHIVKWVRGAADFEFWVFVNCEIRIDKPTFSEKYFAKENILFWLFCFDLESFRLRIKIDRQNCQYI